MTPLTGAWPLFGLQLNTPRLVLRPIRDVDIPGLVRATLAGIHHPDSMPFQVPWTRQPADQMARGTAQNVWLQRANVSPARWSVGFAVLVDGAVVGRQDVAARDFAELKTIETGSWLSQPHQGRGLGKEMRAAALLWAFDHLDAEIAETAVMAGNAASAGVSTSLGYRANGWTRKLIAAGEWQRTERFILQRDEMKRPDWQLEVMGNEAVRPLLGA